MPGDYRQELGYFEVVGVFGLSLLPSDEVGTTFANEIMSFGLTVAAGSLLITSLITTLTPGVILHLTCGLQVLNRVRHKPMQLSHSIIHADYTRDQLDQLGYIRRVGYRFAP